MDTLPHNGASSRCLPLGLTHRQAIKMCCDHVDETAAVFVAIAFFYLTGITEVLCTSCLTLARQFKFTLR